MSKVIDTKLESGSESGSELESDTELEAKLESDSDSEWAILLSIIFTYVLTIHRWLLLKWLLLIAHWLWANQKNCFFVDLF